MPHARQQIREAAAALLTGLATTGSRVSQSRMRSRADALLPALLIETNDENVNPFTIGDRLERSLTLSVRGFAKSAANVDDTLDTIALEVETAIAADPRLGGLAASTTLQSIRVEFDDDTDKPVGVITLEFTSLYFTAAGAPGVIV